MSSWSRPGRFFGAPSVNDAEFNELMGRIVVAHPERAK
jgi:hypothetical protein